MKLFFKFLAGFLQEPDGKSSLKRIIVMSAMFLIGMITYANLFFKVMADYALLAALVVIVLFGIGAITKLSEQTLDKILDLKKEQSNNLNKKEI